MKIDTEKIISDNELSISNMAKKTGVSLRQLYYWEKIGIMKPKFERFGTRLFRRYQKSDIILINKITGFLAEGYKLKRAAEKAINDS